MMKTPTHLILANKQDKNILTETPLLLYFEWYQFYCHEMEDCSDKMFWDEMADNQISWRFSKFLNPGTAAPENKTN